MGKIINPVSFLNKNDRVEKVLDWPGTMEDGGMTISRIRPGLNVGIRRFSSKDEVTADFKRTNMPLTITFCLQGSVDLEYQYPGSSAFSAGVNQGAGMIWYRPAWEESGHLPGREFKSVSLYIDPRECEYLEPDNRICLPGDFLNLINGDPNASFCRVLSYSPAIITAVHQILNCSYQGKLKHLFLEAKSLELISYTLEQLAVIPVPHPLKSRLRPCEVEKVRHAGELLCLNLEHPPTLDELTKRVELNREKLNRGFRYLFGMSAFEYLRIKRLEKARNLLETRDMNVSEVAFDVGYNHPKNFARAFKQYFGVTPTDFLRLNQSC